MGVRNGCWKETWKASGRQGGQLRAAGASGQEKMDVDVEPSRRGHVQGITESEPQISSGTSPARGRLGQGARLGQTGQLPTWPRVTRPEQAHYFLIPPSFSREATNLNVHVNHGLSAYKQQAFIVDSSGGWEVQDPGRFSVW